MAAKLKQYLRTQIRALRRVPMEKLLETRYKRFRDFGVFFDSQKAADTAPLRGSFFPPQEGPAPSDP